MPDQCVHRVVNGTQHQQQNEQQNGGEVQEDGCAAHPFLLVIRFLRFIAAAAIFILHIIHQQIVDVAIVVQRVIEMPQFLLLLCSILCHQGNVDKIRRMVYRICCLISIVVSPVCCRNACTDRWQQQRTATTTKNGKHNKRREGGMKRMMIGVVESSNAHVEW